MTKRLTIELDAPIFDWLVKLSDAIAEQAGEPVPPSVIAAGILQGAYLEDGLKVDLENKDE